ncbi:hypothetical protein CVT24_000330 [Panaeolus cyanescens]|uniref:Beta-xylanase n=1 Tax=Panaeolus cyanescens TaxID=181874 RepID=A0A409VIY8_9AGAR|nr:hypothetical protein CVT24_000330 [Panaeolus cyanescens]
MLLSAKFIALVGFVSAAPLALAQSPVWGQCGGQGWTGPTTCEAGSVCTYSNPWYSQCLPGSNPGPTTTTTPTTTPTSSPTGGNPTPTGSTLAALGKSIGWKYVGGATDPGGDFNDSGFVNTYTREFNAATPVNSMKWASRLMPFLVPLKDATERSRNVFSFGTADQMVAWAQQRNMIIRATAGHTCVWHSQLPSWVSNGGFNAATLTQIIQNHVTQVVGHFKGKLYVTPIFKCNAWDVVNEIFNEDGTFRRSVFYNTLGESFVEIAFRAARAADPNAKLYINDYNTDSTNAKSAAVLNIVKKLKAQGVPIDGIGVQAHLIVGQVPSTFQANLQQFASAGVEVAITELDIRMPTPASQANLAQQQRDYQTVFAACKRVPACVGIQVWGLTDKYSWVPNTFPGYGAALPFDNVCGFISVTCFMYTQFYVIRTTTRSPPMTVLLQAFVPKRRLSALVAAAPVALAQSPAWGQCGGQGWTGPTVDIFPCRKRPSLTIGFIFRHGSGGGGGSTTTSSSPTTTSSSPQPTGSGLAAIGKSIGWKYVGGATDPGGDFNDATFVSTYQREYNMVTPANSMKWVCFVLPTHSRALDLWCYYYQDATERSRNVFTFSTADQLVSWAQQRNFMIRGEYAWDVVNEIFNEDGTLRSSVFSNTLGESFVEIAFRAARAADPDAKLYINDYNTDSTNAKSAGLLNLVKKLKAQGVPIDGIGVQAHLIVGQVPSTFQANLAQFAAAGVEVAITELDIRMPTPATQANLLQQQKDYQTVFAACKAVKACVGISMWGLTDKYSWIPSVFNGYGAALPWDNNYNKKPAYDGAVAGMLS